jgi:hypothetical protein
MPRLHLEHFEEDRETSEVSTENFDRVAFAQRALALVNPSRTRVAICPGAQRLRIEAGRRWGTSGERWAVLAMPNNASRRAIAKAVLELQDGSPAAPWALDVLMGDAGRSLTG